ncbi:bacillithiol biosynthesis deacetylase BshB1 [Candidatus Sumerlaeota bacterium]|nr:bacillithiol biosynthesis deacetylase BshB1 [Candidatus Sumerlaeota bacterium]
MDVLAIGAHPDDCELFMGGTLAKLAALGYQVAVADLTRGERASRGTPEQRAEEAQAAAKILRLTARLSLDLGDGQVGLGDEDRVKVISLIRSQRPSVIFSHWPEDRHPDHPRVSQLVREAFFFASVERFETAEERFRPGALVEFIGNIVAAPPVPSFIVPISDTFERKMESLRAYKSQFYDHYLSGTRTWISSKTYFDQIEAQARYWGSLIGENYGEPFCCRAPLSIADPVELFKKMGAERP